MKKFIKHDIFIMSDILSNYFIKWAINKGKIKLIWN